MDARSSALMSAENASDSDSCSPDRLYLDKHSLADLEIFSSTKSDTSLFKFCNFTRTKGGESALRLRMEAPWNSQERIAATQAAVRFITANKHLFEMMPTGFVVGSVNHYLHEILPMVGHDNFFEFTMDAYTLWATHDRHYFNIVRGSKLSRRFVDALKLFVDQAGIKNANGELAPLLEEMAGLLQRPKLVALPGNKKMLGVWRTLKIDRNLRCHELSTMLRLLELVFEIDALVSMAQATLQHQLLIPEITTGNLQVIASDLVHPYLEKPTGNPVNMNQDARGIFLTGPNMAGKTTYIRAFGVALYLAHLGMGVPAKQFSFTPVEQFYTSISLDDDIHSGVSYFRAEALRVKTIAKAITAGYRVVAIMDEPFKGTNVKDTHEASLAILQRLAARKNCLFIFSSHQIELGDELKQRKLPIACHFFAAIEDEARLRFDYRLRDGVSQQRIGMRVLSEEGVFALFDNNDS